MSPLSILTVKNDGDEREGARGRGPSLSGLIQILISVRLVILPSTYDSLTLSTTPVWCSFGAPLPFSSRARQTRSRRRRTQGRTRTESTFSFVYHSSDVISRCFTQKGCNLWFPFTLGHGQTINYASIRALSLVRRISLPVNLRKGQIKLPY